MSTHELARNEKRMGLALAALVLALGTAMLLFLSGCANARVEGMNLISRLNNGSVRPKQVPDTPPAPQPSLHRRYLTLPRWSDKDNAFIVEGWESRHAGQSPEAAMGAAALALAHLGTVQIMFIPPQRQDGLDHIFG